METTPNEDAVERSLDDLIRACGVCGPVDMDRVSTWIVNLTTALERSMRLVAEGVNVVHVPGEGLLIVARQTVTRAYGEGFRQGVGAMLLAIFRGNMQGLELAASGLPVTIEATREEWAEAEEQAELLHRPAAGETC
jgi:hypothetical protein